MEQKNNELSNMLLAERIKFDRLLMVGQKRNKILDVCKYIITFFLVMPFFGFLFPDSKFTPWMIPISGVVIIATLFVGKRIWKRYERELSV